MYQITVSEEIKNACPIFKGAAVYAEVTNTAFCEGLWEEINTFTQELTSTTQPEDIKLQPAIAATREAYKRCGKDPSRYRPSKVQPSMQKLPIQPFAKDFGKKSILSPRN